MAVVDQTDLYGDQNLRMWLDEQGGFILRQQHFTNSDPKQILKESRVTAIAYNVDFPQQLFDPNLPWRGGFAADYTGRPEPASPTPSALPTPNDEKQIPKFYPPELLRPLKKPTDLWVHHLITTNSASLMNINAISTPSYSRMGST